MTTCGYRMRSDTKKVKFYNKVIETYLRFDIQGLPILIIIISEAVKRIVTQILSCTSLKSNLIIC